MNYKDAVFWRDCLSHVTDENDRRTRKGDFGQSSTRASGRRYTFDCIIDKKQCTPSLHIRGRRVPYL